ncbi:hypothetical protein GCM10027059_03580 [Myceligenerans halotolerans]
MPEVVSSADLRAATAPRTGVRIAVLIAASLVACLSVAGMFLIASPSASAHDQLLSSDPADGDELDAMPATIVLTFSGEPLETGAEVVITGEDGTSVGLEDLTVDGAVLTASVPSTLPGGTYDAAWHIVSGDGHPLEGTFSFAVDAPEPSATPEDAEPTEEPTEAASEAAADGSEPTEAIEEPADAGDDADAAGSDASPETSAGIPSGAAGLALIGGLAVVVVMLVVRWRRMENEATTRRRDSGDAAAGTGSAGGNSDDGDTSGSSGGDSGSGSGGDSGGGGGD